MSRPALPTATAMAMGALFILFVLQSAAPAHAASPTVYTPGMPVLATLTNGGASTAPWNISQGDSGSAAYPSLSPGTLLPTYTPGGATTGSGATAEPNLAVYPSANSGSAGVAPYPSGVAGTPGPLDDYCGTGPQPESASVSRQTAGTFPFAPAYFPHVLRNGDGSLTGYFDYRPKDADEALVAASSTDNGHSWTYQGEALEQNPGFCPSADINDDGEGHANVINVGGTTFLYTLQRPAGDNQGVGMLIHPLNATPATPLAGVPAAEKVGIDPDAFASSQVAVPFTGGTPATVALGSTGAAGSPEQLMAGQFDDLTQNPAPTKATLITCTSVGSTSLSGCTTAAAAGITIQPNDLIEQVMATVTTAATVPTGPNNSIGTGGLATLSVAFVNQSITGAMYNNNAPNRAYVDGVAIYCSQANADPTTKMENCTTGPGGPAVSAGVGDPVTSDPIIPATALQSTGLVAPDGIVGVLPSYPGVPAGATTVLYTEKILNFFVAGLTANGAATTFGSSIAFTPSTNEAADMPAVISAANPVTVSVGDITTGGIDPVTCTGLTTGATDTLTGCTVPSADATHQYTTTSFIGAPGATTVPDATLQLTGQGVASPPSAKNVAKLLKNNEDLTVLRVADTTDGVAFSTAGLANGGVISGASNGAASYQDINNPSSTVSPANLNAFASPGTADATEMRFVGSAGTILTNPDGSFGLFLSGAWGADGDSDAFNQIFYSESSDGENWTVPTTVVSTDYTFAASAAQDASLASGSDAPLGINAYYSGRAYGPSVVTNADGTLTMMFAGYRSPKPIVSAGTPLGQWTVGTTDPALYRNIMAVTLTTSPGTPVPEVPYPILLPILAAAILGIGLVARRRRGIATNRPSTRD